jgi:hypothetical protein
MMATTTSNSINVKAALFALQFLGRRRGGRVAWIESIFEMVSSALILSTVNGHGVCGNESAGIFRAEFSNEGCKPSFPDQAVL